MVIYRHKDKYSISKCADFSKYQEVDIMLMYLVWKCLAKDLPLAEKIKECQENTEKLTDTAEYIYGLKGKGYITTPRQYSAVMQKYDLLSVIRRKKYRNYGEYLHRYPNLLTEISKQKDQTKNG